MSRLKSLIYVLMFLAIGLSLGACEEFPQDLPIGTYRFVESHQKDSAWYETNAMEFTFDDKAKYNDCRGRLQYYIGQTGSQGSRDELKASKVGDKLRCFAPYDIASFFFDMKSNKVFLDFSQAKEVNPLAKKIKSIKYDGWSNTIQVELKEKISIFGDKTSFKLVHKDKPMWEGMI